MRTPPTPAFPAALDEPILCAFEAQRIPAATPSEVLRLPGRKELRPCVEYYYRQLKALPRRLRRTLQRRYARSLGGVALLLALGQAPALAATITVGGGCTLVDAITAANTDHATGGCPAGSGTDIIEFTGNVTLTEVDNAADGSNGLPSVTSIITLNGNGHTLQRSTVTGTPDFRLLHVADTGNLTVNQITLRNGRAPFVNYLSRSHFGGAVFSLGTVALNDSTASGNSARGGGGVSNGYLATLTLTDSTVSHNTADSRGGGGVYNGVRATFTLTNSTISGNNTARYGGGVYNDRTATLTLTDSTVSDNTAGNRGGGVFTLGRLVDLPNGSTTLTNSTVSDNTAGYRGGGVYNGYGATLTLTDSTVSGNTAASGAGVFNVSRATLTLTNSTVSGNNTTRSGGGVYNGYRATLTLTDSTVSGNSSARRGGGVFNNSDTLIVTNSTVAGNTAGERGGGVYNYFFGTLALAHSLISGNTAPSSPEVHNYTGPYNSGAVFADNFNLLGTNGDAGVVGFTPGPTDIVPVAGVTLADILDPLADNGGPTQTHALVAGSPAVDAGPIDKDCSVMDQREIFRPQGAACDIGAFEVGVEPDPFALPTPTAGCTVNGVPDQPCRGTAGPDRIIGTTRTDVILGLEGDDYVNDRRGDNRVFGGPGNDRLIGGKGSDQFFGQEGDDDLRGYTGNDLLEGGDGSDRLKGHEGNDRLRGGDGDDALRGLEGQDTLEGGDGSDLLRGGGDADTLNGDPGPDRLVGGGGIDRCTSDAEDNIVVLCE